MILIAIWFVKHAINQYLKESNSNDAFNFEFKRSVIPTELNNDFFFFHIGSK